MQFLQRDFWLGSIVNYAFHRWMTTSGVPSATVNYRMPSEALSHRRTLMAFPTIDSIIRRDDSLLAGCQLEVMNIANAIARFEPVQIQASPSDADAAWSLASDNVSVQVMPVDSLWIRDTGPVFVEAPDGSLAGIDFGFNYWGENMPTTSHLDRTLAARILDEARIKRVPAALTAEGGAIEVDGKGTFMGTESSLVNANRNPGMTKRRVEQALQSALGVSKFIWLKGIEFFHGDVTDYHIDALARFGPNNTVLLSRPSPYMPTDDPEYQAYAQARTVLESATNADGQPLDIVEFEQPPRTFDEDGNDAELSYVNFLLVNGAVIVPRFGHEKTDLPALDAFRALFPDREVISVFLHYLPRQGGGIHCATQQWPLLPGE